MAAQFSKLAPPAAQAAVNASDREQGLRALSLELSAQEDSSLSALLNHEIARLHERRDDLASAARDQLAATKNAPSFTEPVEALIDIAIRSRSKTNLQKLLGRLRKLTTDADLQVRATLGLALTHLADDDPAGAQTLLEDALKERPSDPGLWLALEGTAANLGDEELLLKAAKGRASQAQASDLKSLLLLRVARQEMRSGDPEAAYLSLRESFDISPSFRSLHTWEQLASQASNFEEAAKVSAETAKLLRSALSDSEKAQAYKIPLDELSSERALAAQVRAIAYAIRADDTELTRRLSEELVENDPMSPLALALLTEVCRSDKDYAGVLQNSSLLERSHEWGDADRTMLLGVQAIAAKNLGDYEHVELFFDAMKKLSPSSTLARVHLWMNAESDGRTEELSHVLEKLSGDGQDPTSFALARALLLLVAGKSEEALALLGEQAPLVDSHDPANREVETALRSLAAFETNKGALYTSECRELARKLVGNRDQAALGWELLRQRLSEENSSAEAEALSSDPSIDPWSQFMLALLDGGGKAAAKGEIDSARGELLKNAVLPAELSHALAILSLAQGGDLSELSRMWGDKKSDPLLSGALISRLEAKGGATLDTTRCEAARNSEDPLLRGAWELRSAFSFLRSGKIELALEALLAAEGPEGKVAATLLPWFSHRKSKGDPVELFALLQGEDELAQEGRLDRAALSHRLARGSSFHWGDSEFTEAERLLRILSSVSSTTDALSNALLGAKVFTDEQRAALALSQPFQVHQGDELLDAARRWTSASSTNAALLTEWVAAQRAHDHEAEANLIIRFSEKLDSDSLLASVRSEDLSEAQRKKHREALLSRAQALTNTLAQGAAANNDSPASSSGDSAAIAWALAEESTDELSPEHASDLAHLAEVLDKSLEDADAQAALLIGGFELLTSAHYEEALELFQRLSKVIPEDLTLCQGIRLAAQRAGRPDLEVTATCELARHAIDNIASAELWERAGVLYQEFLQNPKEAETCFSAALGRCPGRPLAFERLYRFARGKSDRARQVELIDTRLDTAESDRLRVELYWDKARYCRMLGRRTVAVRALSELLKMEPDHLPALALSAELHLVDSRLEAAAETLRLVAKHPDAPRDERTHAGLYASDLLEKLGRPREAVELLQELNRLGLAGGETLERTARSLARAGDWGEAYQAFSMLSEEQDLIEKRLESAQMMLAIQRDHLKDPEDLKVAARSVLRDSPDDTDAVNVVLQQNFSQDERLRLLNSPRQQSLRSLQASPLNPPEIKRFSLLCHECGDEALERIALGNLGLTGRLTDADAGRLAELHTRCPPWPSQEWNQADLEFSSASGQLGTIGTYMRLIAPFIAAEMDPTLDALGISPTMKMSPASNDPLFSEVRTWANAFGINAIDVYFGGADPEELRAMPEEVPAIIVGTNTKSPLEALPRARLAAQLATTQQGMLALLNYSHDLVNNWMLAAECVAGRLTNKSAEVDEMTRSLARRMPRETREELGRLSSEIKKAGTNIGDAHRSVATGAAKAAVLAHGEASILRQLPELLPEDEKERATVVADIIRFVLCPEFLAIRKKAGLEGA